MYTNVDTLPEANMEADYFVEVFCKQRNHFGEHICGDVFRSKRIRAEDRIIAVLSDGMGHGVKANILATFTSSFALNFTEEHKDFEKIADIIMNTLPVNAENSLSYSTFTIVDIYLKGDVSILTYDSPEILIYRKQKQYFPRWTELVMDTEKNKGKRLKTCTFTPIKGDRILFCSDGVVQSGLGIMGNNTGWSTEKMNDYTLKVINGHNSISASELSSKIVNQAFKNDGYHAKDDISCATIYFRDPRKCILCSGPPLNNEDDAKYARLLHDFDGKKIVCGGTTADIISRELGIKIENDDTTGYDEELPPSFKMNTIDIVTEGILTLGKVIRILKNYHNLNFVMGNGPAEKIVEYLLQSDAVYFLVGTKINITNHGPDLEMELEVRRTLIKRLSRLLEDTYLKDVYIRYI